MRAERRGAPMAERITVDLNSEERLGEETAAALRHGFGAKLLVHPGQVEPVRRLMAPSETDVAWAERVLAADAAGAAGAVRLDGRMVDRPVVEAARRTLARRAASSGGAPCAP